jgi:hypothetical protein
MRETFSGMPSVEPDQVWIGPMFRNGSFASVWPDHGGFQSTPVNGHSRDRWRLSKVRAKRRHQFSGRDSACAFGSGSDLASVL